MIYKQLKGGLGNQLFEIFAIIAYSLNNKISFRISSFKQEGQYSPAGGYRPTYWDNFLSSIKSFTYHQPVSYPVYKEPEFSYIPIPIVNKDTHFQIDGYFQSEKYFKSQYDNVLRLLKFNTHRNKIKELYFKDNNFITISLHIRLGDNLTTWNQQNHPIQTIDFYINSIQTIIDKLNTTQNIKIYYFCEKQDTDIALKDIQILQKNFPNIIFLKFDKVLTDWEELLAMSCCNHNIVSNSTFSWWAAYFNDFQEKIICYTSKWFGPNLKHHDLKDLFPETWIKI